MSLPLPLNSKDRETELKLFREKQIADLLARRKARGMSDPLNRLRQHVDNAIANGAPIFENKES